MKFKGIICAVLVVLIMAAVAGCNDNTIDSTTTSPATTTTTTTAVNGTTTVTGITTTSGGGDDKTTSDSGTHTTTITSDVTTTTGDDVLLPTISGNTSIRMEEVTISGLPVIVGDRSNRLRISAAGFLDGNKKNPLFIFVTNVGDDDIYSATINANAGGKEICFNISFLPRGASVWAESIDNYVYSASDKFIVRNDAIIVSSTMSGVPVDINYAGILKLYAGNKSGSRGLYIENVSGKKISKLVIKYRPRVSEGGLFATPYVLELKDVEPDSKYFKPNAYLYDVDISDVQITY